MIRLTVCVITRNEERNIGRCLESAAFADEIIVVDSGSTDRTAAIAEARGARVVPREWPGYGPQKDYAFSLAGGEWILSIDADEEVSEALRKDILLAVVDPAAADGYYFPRENRIGGRTVRYGGPFHNAPDLCLRLFRRGRGRTRGSLVHEGMAVDGKKSVLPGALIHHAYADWTEYMRAMDEYAVLSAVRAFREGRGLSAPGRLLNVLFRSGLTFVNHLIARRALLHGLFGLRLAAGQAVYAARKYFWLDLLRQTFGRELPAEFVDRLLRGNR